MRTNKEVSEVIEKAMIVLRDENERINDKGDKYWLTPSDERVQEVAKEFNTCWLHLKTVGDWWSESHKTMKMEAHTRAKSLIEFLGKDNAKIQAEKELLINEGDSLKFWEMVNEFI